MTGPVAVLIGPMAAGKTSVGRALAARLGVPFADLDALIVQEAGRTIPDIFADEGEPAFREREARSLVRAVAHQRGVLSLGGGVVSIGAGILSFLTGVIIVVILTIYFAVSMPTIKSAMLSLVAASSRPTVESVTEEVTRSIGRYVLGQVSLGVINGVCSAIFLTIIGAPLPALLAFVAFLASLIPLVGPITGAIIITASCLMVSPGLGDRKSVV